MSDVNDSSWIDEILEHFETETRAYALDGGTNAEERKTNRIKTKAAIEAELVRIIGEDEHLDITQMDSAHGDKVHFENILRAEQRERAGINLKGGASDETTSAHGL